MHSYSLHIGNSAQKELDALDEALFTRIDKRVIALAENPRPTGCKKLSGYKDLWRMRIGDYRVIYSANDTTKTVTITHVAHRREVYE